MISRGEPNERMAMVDAACYFFLDDRCAVVVRACRHVVLSYWTRRPGNRRDARYLAHGKRPAMLVCRPSQVIGTARSQTNPPPLEGFEKRLFAIPACRADARRSPEGATLQRVLSAPVRTIHDLAVVSRGGRDCTYVTGK
jgi:hypothetical protein